MVSVLGAQGDVAPFVDAISCPDRQRLVFRDQRRVGRNDQRRGVLSGPRHNPGIAADQIHAADVTGAGFISMISGCMGLIHFPASPGSMTAPLAILERTTARTNTSGLSLDRVGQVDTHSDRAARIEHGVDKGNLSREGSGKGLTGESNGLPYAAMKIRFIGFELDPKVGEIGNV